MYDHRRVYWECESRVIKPAIRKVRNFLKVFDMSIKLLRSSAKYRKIPETISIREILHPEKYGKEYLVGRWSYGIVDSEGFVNGLVTFDLCYRIPDTQYFLRMWLQMYEFGEEIEYAYGDTEKLATVISREILRLLMYAVFNDPEERGIIS